MKGKKLFKALSFILCIPFVLPQARAQAENQAHLPSGIVAVVNGHPITQSEVDALRTALKMPDTKVAHDQIKFELIVRRLILEDAESKGYGSRQEVRDAKNNAEIQSYLHDALPSPVPSDEEVRKEYARRKYRSEKMGPFNTVKDTIRKEMTAAAALRNNQMLVNQLEKHATIQQ